MTRLHGSRSWWRSPEFMAFLLAIVCFANVLPNGYVYDGKAIVRNSPKVTAPGQWRTIWTTDYWSEAADTWLERDLLYRPVALTSYRAVHTLFGERAAAQHAANILLHALASLLIVRLCRALGGDGRAALIAGGVFAVLPIHTEVVANIVGRADILATLGVIGAALCHRRSMLADGNLAIARWRIAAAVLAFLAMGAKESGVAVLPVVVLMDVYVQQANRGHRWFRPATIVRLTYLLAPALLYFGLRFAALQGNWHQAPAVSKTANFLVDTSPAQHALGVVQLWGMYWAKTVWPAVLSVSYSINAIRPATSITNPHVLLGLLTTAALAVASVVAWRRNHKGVAIAALIILACYLPTSQALVLMRVTFAERIWYLPSIGLAVLAGFALAKLATHRAGRILLSLMIAAMLVRCWVRNPEWKNNGTIYRAAYRAMPEAIAALNLYGEWNVYHGDIARGIELLQKALTIDQGFIDAHRALAKAYLKVNQPQAAIYHLQVAAAANPDDHATADLLANVTSRLAATDERLRELRATAEANPEDLEAQLALIHRLRDLGQWHDVFALFDDAPDALRSSPTWQHEHAISLAMAGRRDEAIDRMKRAVELSHDDTGLIVELAMLLLDRRKPATATSPSDLDQARELSNRAMSLAPDDPIVNVCRAELLALQGQIDDAIQHYRRAIDLSPPDSPQRPYWQQRVKSLGG